MNESFGKEYKLCSKKRISEVFEAGQSIKLFPFVVHYTVQKRTVESTHFQIVLSAPKRNFRKAHDRNRIKRLMRESIRKNKLPLETFLEQSGQCLALFLIYTSREEMSLSNLEKKAGQLISQLIKHIEK